MRWVLALLCFLASGCLGGSGEDSAPLDGTDSAGCIRSLLVDEQVRPVAGAHIQIPAIGWATVTDEDGTYGYEGVPDGNHTVVAHWDGGHREFQALVRDGCLAWQDSYRT